MIFILITVISYMYFFKINIIMGLFFSLFLFFSFIIIITIV
jgi:hypothetical protein